MKYIVVVVLLLAIVSCAPKYSIKYDIEKTNQEIPNFSSSKIGIFLFEDNRPLVERTGKSGMTDTYILRDEAFEKSIPVIVNEAMKNHLQSCWNSEVQILDKTSNEVNIESLEYLKIEKYDYVLIGSIDHFTQMSFDEHFTVRMAGSLISGCLWPLAPIIFPISVTAGEVQKTTEIDFNNILLVDTRGPQILWKGQCKTKITENTSPVAGSEIVLRLYSESLKKSISCMCSNILLSSKMGFPNKLSSDQTIKVISHISRNKSLNNLEY